MAVSLIVVQSDVVGLLNAGTPGTYSSVVVDPRWTTQQVVDCILSADSAVCQAVFRNRNNARIGLFNITQSGVIHGAEIIAAAGPVSSVKFIVTGGSAPGTRVATEQDAQEIEAEIRNALSLNYDPHFAFEGRTLSHNGSAVAAKSGGGTVSVNVTYPSFTQTAACQAPEEYRWVVLCGAMAQLVPTEGENMNATGSWANQFADGLAMIATGEGNVSKQVEDYVKQRMAA